MITRFQNLIVLIIVIIFSAGCTSQTDKTVNSEMSIPTTEIRDLHSVKFHLVDQNNTPIYNAFIIASYNSTKYPDLLNTPNNNTGSTDENGNLTFVMRGSIPYDLTVSNIRDKQEITISITPRSVEYLIQITPTPLPTPVPIQTNELEKFTNENFWYRVLKDVCSVTPYFTDALNC